MLVKFVALSVVGEDGRQGMGGGVYILSTYRRKQEIKIADCDLLEARRIVGSHKMMPALLDMPHAVGNIGGNGIIKRGRIIVVVRRRGFASRGHVVFLTLLVLQRRFAFPHADNGLGFALGRIILQRALILVLGKE